MLDRLCLASSRLRISAPLTLGGCVLLSRVVVNKVGLRLPHDKHARSAAAAGAMLKWLTSAPGKRTSGTRKD